MILTRQELQLMPIEQLFPPRSQASYFMCVIEQVGPMRKHYIPNQSLIKYLALSIWSLAATFTSATAILAQNTAPLETTTSPTEPRIVPPDALACIPTGQVVSTELIGSSTYEGKTYYLIAAYNRGGFPSDVVIAAKKERCQRLYYNPNGQNAPFSSNVPEPVARQLNSQRPKY